MDLGQENYRSVQIMNRGLLCCSKACASWLSTVDINLSQEVQGFKTQPALKHLQGTFWSD
jgi:hypothetical protein